MGSKCSILNDTEHDVWITHEIHREVLFVSVTVALAAVLAGGGIALAISGVSAAGLVSLGGEKLKAIPSQFKDAVLNISMNDLSKILNTTGEEAKKRRADNKDFQESAKLVKPGDKYTWSGSLSLVKKVYVMNDKLQRDERGCFTGPTANSEYVYPISEYFKKLDVKKKPEDTYTVYSRK